MLVLRAHACHGRRPGRHRAVPEHVVLFSHGAAGASGLALVNTIGTLGGFFGPVIVGTLKARTGDYGAAMAALGAAQLLAALIVLAAGRALIAFPQSRQTPSQ
jgi:nitrate/nitrite transporter NarK